MPALPATSSRGAKRKAVSLLQEPAKRTRLEIAATLDDPKIDNDGDFGSCRDEDEDEDDEEEESFSDDSEFSKREGLSRSESPNTPISPSRKASNSKIIRCDFEGCTKTYSKLFRLEDHLGSHSAERTFSCSYERCDKAFFGKLSLLDHTRLVHTNTRHYSCSRKDCNKSFRTAQRLTKHLEVHDGHDRFRCREYPPCEEHFRKHQTLQRHIRTVHLGLLAFPCIYVNPTTGDQCEDEFESSTTLRRHVDRIHGPLRFWCDECSLEMNEDGSVKQVGFTTQSKLSKHISTAHAQCIFCDAKCCSQKELEKHVETKHARPTPKQVPGDVEERKIFTCTYLDCNKIFTRNKNLTAHIRTIHEKIRFKCVSEPPKVPYKDPEVLLWSRSNSCGREFFTKQNLEEHIRTQHLELPSLVSTKRSKPQASVKERTRNTRFACVVEPPAVPYKDPEVAHWGGTDACGDDFKTKHSLEDHIRVQHLNLAPLNKPNPENSARPRKERVHKLPQAIDVLTGAAFDDDERRNIPCLVDTCPWFFIRKFDHEQHLRTEHGLSPKGKPLQVDPSIIEDEYNEDGSEWELQQGIVQEDVSFWIGSRAQFGDKEDDWTREQNEMRSLIDPELLDL